MEGLNGYDPEKEMNPIIQERINIVSPNDTSAEEDIPPITPLLLPH